MDMSGLTLMHSLQQKMKWLNKNQEVVAMNIAQADTPGYRAKRLKPMDFGDVLAQAQALEDGVRMPRMPTVQVAQLGNVASDAAPGGLALPTATYRAPVYEVSPDGNSVALEEELLVMADNQMEYSLMTQLYRRHMGMLRTALGKSQ